MQFCSSSSGLEGVGRDKALSLLTRVKSYSDRAFSCALASPSQKPAFGKMGLARHRSCSQRAGNRSL